MSVEGKLIVLEGIAERPRSLASRPGQAVPPRAATSPSATERSPVRSLSRHKHLWGTFRQDAAPCPPGCRGLARVSPRDWCATQAFGEHLRPHLWEDTTLDTQSERLYRWLRNQGIAVERTQEPTYGPVGAQIRLYQQGRLQFDPATLALFCTADRMDHLGREDGILSRLADGHHVLCVRYLLFSFAHQLDQVDLGWHRQINARCRAPDLTLFIDGALETKRLRENYARVIELLQREGEYIVSIDGGGTEDEVHRACQHRIAALLGL